MAWNSYAATVSIVVPTRNRAEIILETLRSVVGQPYRPLDLVIVDDGSDDDTLDVVDEWAVGERAADINISVLSKQREGAPAARNFGLERAGGEFVMFLDSDDLIEGDLLGGIVRRMEEEHSDMGFGPVQRLYRDTGKRSVRRVPSYASSEDLFTRWVGYSEPVETCSLVWRTSFVREIGGWRVDIRKNQDGEIANRAVLRGAKFSVSDQGCGIYVRH